MRELSVADARDNRSAIFHYNMRVHRQTLSMLLALNYSLARDRTFMPRYFSHLVDGEGVLLDPEGVEMSVDAIQQHTLMNARDCIAGDVREGLIDLHYRLEIHDETGRVVHTLSFADAVTVVSG